MIGTLLSGPQGSGTTLLYDQNSLEEIELDKQEDKIVTKRIKR